jgi:iron complex outermembrane recepter protein
MFSMRKLLVILSGALVVAVLAPGHVIAAESAQLEEQITVVGTTPTNGTGIALGKLPFNVQGADSDALERAQSLDLTDFLSTNLSSVNINSAQNNPLQPDVQYRGFTASPLLGLPMGMSVYQNGVRINEPLGDAVNWDLLPESAIHNITLIGGANPLFGLNTLGGALSVQMKNGFNFEGHQAEFSGGSFSRKLGSIESGGNNGQFGYYVNVSYFDEDGWRDLSESDALNIYSSFSWRGADSSFDTNFQYGKSELTGNGASPVGLLAIDRQAIFTAPDITENDMHMFSMQGTHDVNETIEFAGNAFYRKNTTDSFNGDGSEFVSCELDGGNFLIEGIEEDDLEAIGFDGDDICEDNVLGGGRLFGGNTVTDPESLEAALNILAGEDEFNVDDLTDELSGTGNLEHGGINNVSDREQKSYGADGQLTFTQNIFGRGNYFVSGFSYFKGEADFVSVTELSRLDPRTRSTSGLGIGTFVGGAATDIATSTETFSFYFLNALDVTDKVTLTFGGRFNDTDVVLRDQSGRRPELNGDHNFSRFNPSIGLTFDATENLNIFGGYSESMRAPTPIELACNEGVFEVAREFAIARGDDPDDVDFECRLPNAFLADPPLDEVVAKSYELGIRGEFGPVKHRIGYYHTTNNDDIIFQTTGRSTGLFANIDETLRQGIETAFSGSLNQLDWSLSYSYTSATFEDNFMALSPSHDFANDAGQIAVSKGDRIPGIPEHQLKLGGDYHLPFEVSLGFDLILNSDQVLRGDESNQLNEVDGYTLVNLRANCNYNEKLSMFVRVSNLFDTDYENFGLLGEDPSEIISNLDDNRARFLGAGAERGIWAGFRVRI